MPSRKLALNRGDWSAYAQRDSGVTAFTLRYAASHSCICGWPAKP